LIHSNKPTYLFLLKSIVKKNTIKVFAEFIIIAVLMFGQIIRIAEALKFFLKIFIMQKIYNLLIFK